MKLKVFSFLVLVACGADAALVTGGRDTPLVDAQGNNMGGPAAFRSTLLGQPGWSHAQVMAFKDMSPAARLEFLRATPGLSGVNYGLLQAPAPAVHHPAPAAAVRHPAPAAAAAYHPPAAAAYHPPAAAAAPRLRLPPAALAALREPHHFGAAAAERERFRPEDYQSGLTEEEALAQAMQASLHTSPTTAPAPLSRSRGTAAASRTDSQSNLERLAEPFLRSIDREDRRRYAGSIIEAIREIPERERAGVLDAAEQLLDQREPANRDALIRAVAAIRPLERNLVLRSAAELFANPNLQRNETKAEIINGIRGIPPTERDSIMSFVRELSTPVDESGAQIEGMIRTLLGLTRPQREELVRQLNTLCRLLPSGNHGAKSVIRDNFLKIPEPQRAGIIREAVDQFSQGSASPDRLIELVETAQRRINRRQPQAYHGDAYGVHNYAGTEVSGGAACAVGVRLNDAILHKIREILGQTPIISFGEAEAFIITRISQVWGADHRAQRTALAALGKGFEGVGDRDKQDLCVVVTFLQREHPGASSQNLWTTAFLGESMEAYGHAEDEVANISCEKGVRERAVLGLRTIDRRLDSIFEQVEGASYAKFVFTASNPSNPAGIVFIENKLRELGFHPGGSGMTSERAEGLYKAYLESLVARYPSLRSQYSGGEVYIAEAVKDAIEEGRLFGRR